MKKMQAKSNQTNSAIRNTGSIDREKSRISHCGGDAGGGKSKSLSTQTSDGDNSGVGRGAETSNSGGDMGGGNDPDTVNIKNIFRTNF